MAGYANGLRVAGYGIKPPSKGERILTKFWINEGIASLDIYVPGWAHWALIEVLGTPFYSSFYSIWMAGGDGGDCIKKVIPGEQITINAQAGSVAFTRALFPGYSTFGAGKYVGGFHRPSPLYSYPPKYGALNDPYAQDPATYCGNYGLGGGGRLAGRLTLQNGASAYTNRVQGVGGSPRQYAGSSPSHTSIPNGAVCITFAERSPAPLIEVLNEHYLDGWGTDWRDIPKYSQYPDDI